MRTPATSTTANEDGGGSSVGIGEVGAKLLVFHGRSAEVLVSMAALAHGFFCVLRFVSGDLVESCGVVACGMIYGVSLFCISGGDSVRFFLLLFCERVGVYVVPVGGLLVRAAVVLGSGGLVSRPLVSMPAVADSSSSPSVDDAAADVLSTKSMRHGVVMALAVAAIPEFGVLHRDGRWIVPCCGCRFRRPEARMTARRAWKLGVLFGNFQLFQGVLRNLAGMYCALSF